MDLRKEIHEQGTYGKNSFKQILGDFQIIQQGISGPAFASTEGKQASGAKQNTFNLRHAAGKMLSISHCEADVKGKPERLVVP